MLKLLFHRSTSELFDESVDQSIKSVCNITVGNNNCNKVFSHILM